MQSKKCTPLTGRIFTTMLADTRVGKSRQREMLAPFCAICTLTFALGRANVTHLRASCK